MRNKFIYSWSIKIHVLEFDRLLNSNFLCPAGYGSIFPAKSCWDAWRSGSQLARGSVNMTDEAKFHSPIYSMFEQLVMWCVVRHCHGEKLGPFYWPMPAAGIAVFGASHWFAEHYFSNVMVLLELGKLQWIRPEADHQTVTMIFFGCKFGFGKCFGASSRSSYWGGHHQLSYKIHFSSHVTTKWRHGLLLLHSIREGDTSKWWLFKF